MNMLNKETKRISKWLLVGLLLLSCAFIAPVMAVTEIDILAHGVSNTCTGTGGGIIADNTFAAGTGRIDPFLTTFTPKGTKVTEEGINVPKAKKQWETFYGGSRTHFITLGEVPTVEINAVKYKEFDLDANEAGNVGNQFLSIGMLRIYVSKNQVWDYDPSGVGSFGHGSATKVWDLDIACDGTDAFVALDYTLDAGSGKGDLALFIPVSSFGTAADTDYVTIYTQFANPAAASGMDLTTNDGFEEWGVKSATVSLPPVLQLVKTVTTSYPSEHAVLTPADFQLCANGDALGFCYQGDELESWREVTAGVAYALSESPDSGTAYISDGWSCDGGKFVSDTITLAVNDEVTCSIHNYDKSTPVPEFPSLALPAGLIIGFIGAILLIRQSKEQ